MPLCRRNTVRRISYFATTFRKACRSFSGSGAESNPITPCTNCGTPDSYSSHARSCCKDNLNAAFAMVGFDDIICSTSRAAIPGHFAGGRLMLVSDFGDRFAPHFFQFLQPQLLHFLLFASPLFSLELVESRKQRFEFDSGISTNPLEHKPIALGHLHDSISIEQGGVVHPGDRRPALGVVDEHDQVKT